MIKKHKSLLIYLAFSIVFIEANVYNKNNCIKQRQTGGTYMAAKNDVQVLIGGKVYTLSGYESDEYLQKIALYINNKIDEMNQIPNYRRMGMDMQKILLELNMADDYHKAKEQIHVLEADIEEKDKNEYDLKHELIAAQIHLEETEKEIENLKNEINELQKQIVKLEARTYRK